MMESMAIIKEGEEGCLAYWSGEVYFKNKIDQDFRDKYLEVNDERLLTLVNKSPGIRTNTYTITKVFVAKENLNKTLHIVNVGFITFDDTNCVNIPNPYHKHLVLINMNFRSGKELSFLEAEKVTNLTFETGNIFYMQPKMLTKYDDVIMAFKDRPSISLFDYVNSNDFKLTKENYETILIKELKDKFKF